ncbi:MAG: hypothetical protein JW723_09445 [Bacteroidales bacterium]|nr:hypothetical protein [Bacteroidales bacterium]
MESMKGRTEKFIGVNTVNEVIDSLLSMNSDSDRFRIERGVNQVADFWRKEDGDINMFREFCLDYFIPAGERLDVFFKKTERNTEVLTGNYTGLALQLREPLELDMGEITPIDLMIGSYNPSSHLLDDFFKNRIAFYQLLNFPFYSLDEKLKSGPEWSRKHWAFARIGDQIVARVPSGVIQSYSDILTLADTYIAEYNIYMHKLTDDSGQRHFPEGLKLISHWGLRDEIKSHYSEKEGVTKQRMVFEVMKRIVTQEIPVQVINHDKFTWNPYTNRIFIANKEEEVKQEKNIRYKYLLDIFQAVRKQDAYYPYYPTALERAFNKDMQIPRDEVEQLFVELLLSSQASEVAKLISTRMGRPLEPFDIWYSGFKPEGSQIDESLLDKRVAKTYPTKDAFESSLPLILMKLGFSREESETICSRITVDPSRGAGHAAGAEMKTEKSHLRTRIGKNGMDYKAYNIAIHEFGHTVEQTLTLYDMDYYSLKGIPNTAFTEALAFAFQKRDLELLGIKSTDPLEKHLMALDIFWSCFEIMGVSLVDIYVWEWLYENPFATADDLKEAVLKISKEVWNSYYAEIFGVKDQAILAIYSHMIAYPLYLSAYPVGHLIDYQIEEYISDKEFAGEVRRIFASGNVTPDLWMKNAVGSGISNKPLLSAVDEALSALTASHDL